MALTFDRSLLNIQQPIADGTQLVIQDLYNQVRVWQALHGNMDERNFLDASGKQGLVGVNEVGITLAFSRGWMPGFEARPGPSTVAMTILGGNTTASHTSTGTATSVDAPGTTLTDTAGRFVRFALQTGDVVRNVTDGSAATVIEPTSESVLTHTALSGGTDDDWGIGDVWEVDSEHPVFPTAFTHATVFQDAAAINVDLVALAALVNAVPDECHWTQAFVEGSTTLRYAVWLERDGAVVTTGLVSAQINWYNAVDATLLFTDTDVSPDSLGVFYITLTQALADDTTYIVDLIVTDADGVVSTRRGIGTAGT